MKRALSLILALVMCLSLCACGSTDNAGSNEVKTYNVNETATTELFECTLTKIEFAGRVDADRDSADYMLPSTTSNIGRPAKDGKTLLCFSVELKYIGKENFVLGMGVSEKEKAIISFTARYDNDYQFGSFVASRKDKSCASGWAYEREYENSYTTNAFNFAPLDEATGIRAFIELPAEVETNTEAPLELEIFLNGDIIKYIVRP